MFAIVHDANNGIPFVLLILYLALAAPYLTQPKHVPFSQPPLFSHTTESEQLNSGKALRARDICQEQVAMLILGSSLTLSREPGNRVGVPLRRTRAKCWRFCGFTVSPIKAGFSALHMNNMVTQFMKKGRIFVCEVHMLACLHVYHGWLLNSLVLCSHNHSGENTKD